MGSKKLSVGGERRETEEGSCSKPVIESGRWPAGLFCSVWRELGERVILLPAQALSPHCSWMRYRGQRSCPAFPLQDSSRAGNKIKTQLLPLRLLCVRPASQKVITTSYVARGRSNLWQLWIWNMRSPPLRYSITKKRFSYRIRQDDNKGWGKVR